MSPEPRPWAAARLQRGEEEEEEEEEEDDDEKVVCFFVESARMRILLMSSAGVVGFGFEFRARIEAWRRRRRRSWRAGEQLLAGCFLSGLWSSCSSNQVGFIGMLRWWGRDSCRTAARAAAACGLIFGARKLPISSCCWRVVLVVVIKLQQQQQVSRHGRGVDVVCAFGECAMLWCWRLHLLSSRLSAHNLFLVSNSSSSKPFWREFPMLVVLDSHACGAHGLSSSCREFFEPEAAAQFTAGPVVSTQQQLPAAAASTGE